MTSISVRQSGGANIISIPKTIVQMLGLSVGSKLNLTVEDNKIVLTPVMEETMSLESLLIGSPKECFTITDEDREWIDARPIGREV
ncbi:MAG: AbrB/MazE/SpoVT family DNA-binding domain-containing protein [Gammaproteobacteria bacterium]|nr:AbrB/MazE/SpoVT family DNA-binding domain-containing protein [Gammaproteobacteria bacterium]